MCFKDKEETADLNNKQLNETLNEVNETNKQLSCKLLALEQQMKLENQMNQINESRIQDLQKLITKQETCKKHYQEIVSEIKCNLKEMIQQNTDLKNTIKDLNKNIAELSVTAKKTEMANEEHKIATRKCGEKVMRWSKNLTELKTIICNKNCKIKQLEQQFQLLYRNHQNALADLEKANVEVREKERDLRSAHENLEKFYENHQDAIYEIQKSHDDLYVKQQELEFLQGNFNELLQKYEILMIESRTEPKCFEEKGVSNDECQNLSCEESMNELRLALEAKDSQISNLQECLKGLYKELDYTISNKQIPSNTCYQQDLDKLRRALQQKDLEVARMQEQLEQLQNEIKKSSDKATMREVDYNFENNSSADCIEVSINQTIIRIQ